MKNSNGSKNNSSSQEATGITRVTVAGYKSINQEQSIEIRPLTILAGANSSGKSSIMQPLLLLKQTLESSYDSGPLLLDGPNVRFTSSDQLLFNSSKGKRANAFQVSIETKKNSFLTTSFARKPKGGLDIEYTTYGERKTETTIRQDMTHEELLLALSDSVGGFADMYSEQVGAKLRWEVIRDRCFLKFVLVPAENGASFLSPQISLSPDVKDCIRQVIHLPGLRGKPERFYPLTAVGTNFPGTFESYTASVINECQADKHDGRLESLSRALEKLGLTWKISAKPINDTQIELQVGRLPQAIRGGAHDLVSIADVGFGVSQALPVLVALHVAFPGQLVYLEQPEIHLHPLAQTAMAQILATAAMRGVRVVAETHSSLLLLGIQTLVAEGKLPPELVKLHWFTRGNDGVTTIRSADLDETGAFGDWPEDFADVELAAESRYLDAAEARQHIH